MRTTLTSQGQAYVAEGIGDMGQDKPHRLYNTSKDWVRVQAQYFLHATDGMTFTQKIPTGTASEGVECDGETYCQFKSFIEAKRFCNGNRACNGILQETNTSSESGCEQGLGCFYPATGHLTVDEDWKRSRGKTYERQVLAYNRYVDGRKLNDVFKVGSRGCGGVTYCQYPNLKPALDFCDLDAECLGVVRMPVKTYGKGCKGGKGCFAPAKGSLFHDPVWRDELGETMLKEQEVAYYLRDQDGMSFDGRFPAGTGGCPGEHNCQFLTLEKAEAYCDSNPTCKGVLKKEPESLDHEACAGGHGCFEPVKGKLKYSALFDVTDGTLYQRQIVR